MSRIKTVLIEDENPARDRLKKFLSLHDEIEIIGEAKDGSEAIKLVNETKPDLVFLDIKLPIHTGFQVLTQINCDPTIVFTTAYDEYAIKAFEVNAIDYLLKPYSRDRLETAISKVLRYLPESNMTEEKLFNLQKDLKEEIIYLTKITVKKGFIYNVIDINDINYFQTDGGLLFAYTENDRFLLDITLKRLETGLSPINFFRCHRNCIVNLTKIKKIIPWGRSTYKIEIYNGKRIDLSREKMKEFKQIIGLI